MSTKKPKTLEDTVMATEYGPNDGEVPANVDQAVDKAVGTQSELSFSPSYKVMTDAKIPISKHEGAVWKGRKQIGERCRSEYEEAWREAMRYYNNDQMGHRNEGSTNRSGNEVQARRINSVQTETENIVFANITTLIPAVYAKNPQIEVTATNPENKAYATLRERLVNSIMFMKHAPGVNAKPKVRRATINALLTNEGWCMINWIPKEQSSENAIQEIQQIAEQLENAQNQSEIEELEGKLEALDKHVDMIDPEGPILQSVSPFNIIRDPESTDLSDARWLLYECYLSTAYLNARYGKSDEEGNIVSAYEPTHVLHSLDSGSSVQDSVDNFQLIQSESSHKDYGFDDKQAFEDAKRTKCYYCWDKTKRRLYLFMDDNWKWPIWVWNDPLNLLEFFPFYRLEFHTNPDGGYAKGEVTYYLDQQDAINEINDEERRARLWAKRNILFNTNSMNKDAVEKFLKGPDGTAEGIDIPEGTRIEDHIFSGIPPGIGQFPQLFDPSRKYEAIDRISSVSAVMRGVEFKTNTTNQAIDTYNSANNMRLDEKIDAIEDFIGNIAFGIMQLCCARMDEATVRAIVGNELVDSAGGWINSTPEELRTQYHLRVVGGSTAKPTSKAKKEEAVAVGQVLGQFAGAAPVVVEIMLKVFQQAFDEITIRDEDWQRIRESIHDQQHQAGAGPDAQSPQEGQEQPNDPMTIIQQMPPQVQEVANQLIEQGAPPEQIVQQIQQMIGAN